jgi:hypothetical protein
MINALFHVPLFSYEVRDWDRKKKALLSRINQNEFDYYGKANFQTDRHSKKNRYALDFESIFDEELRQFRSDAHLSSLKIKDIWTLKYTKKNEGHCVHNHASTGYTGIVYLEHDPKVHPVTTFIGPWNDPVTDQTQLNSIPNAKEGVIYIWPSVLLHYVDGMNTNKIRMITSWDMEVVR